MSEFENSLQMVLNRTLDAIMPEFRELFARYEITEQQWRILRVLWAHKKITTNELSEKTLLPAPSLVGIVDRLEKKKLVLRVRSTTDRRVVYVIATPKGRKIEEEVMPFVVACQQNLKSAVSAAEWEAMLSVLEKIADHATGKTRHTNRKVTGT